MTIYSTTTQEGIDINNVFYLDTKSAPEYPAPPFLPGELAWGTDASEWIFSQATISIAPGSAVVFSAPAAGSWSVTLLTNTNGRTLYGAYVGITGGATGSVTVQAPSGTQTNSYFWVQRAGLAPSVLVGYNTITLNSTVATSATAGQFGINIAATTATINGIVFSKTSGSASSGPAVLNYPTVGIQN